LEFLGELIEGSAALSRASAGRIQPVNGRVQLDRAIDIV